MSARPTDSQPTGPTQRLSSAERSRAVSRVLRITLVLNLVVAAAKGLYGWWVGSLAIASDGLHSTLDAGANILGLFATRHAAKPADAGHPYGHQKFEVVASMALGGLIGVGAVSIGWAAIEALIADTPALPVPAGGIIVIGATLVINIGVALYERHMATVLDSSYLRADAAHTASDIVVTIGVLIAVILSRVGVARADALCALGVFIVILRVAWNILARNAGVLVDRAALDVDAVRAVVAEVPGVHACRDIRSRGSDDAVYLDLAIEVDGALSLRAAHALSHVVEDHLKQHFRTLTDVVIHVEPSAAAEPRPGP